LIVVGSEFNSDGHGWRRIDVDNLELKHNPISNISEARCNLKQLRLPLIDDLAGNA